MVYALVVLALFEPKIVHKKIDEIYSHLKHFNNKQKIKTYKFHQLYTYNFLTQTVSMPPIHKIQKNSQNTTHQYSQILPTFHE